MEMNIKKTKTMVVSKTSLFPKINISLEGSPIHQTNSITYLGSLIIEEGRCEKEVKRRIEIARRAFRKMNKILTSKKITIDTRNRLCVCYVWSTLLYCSETWTLTKIIMKKLQAFEMWMLRRILKIVEGAQNKQ